MQYPLDNVNRFVTEKLVNAVEKHRTSHAPQSLDNLYQTFCQDACAYIATAANDQQAKFILHTMKVALLQVESLVIAIKAKNIKPLQNENYDDVSMLCTGLILAINNMISFLTGNFSNILPVPIPPYVPATDPGKENNVLHTNLSVPQLALFLRLLVDAGIISENNIASLTGKTASIIRTRKKMEVSAESLRIKYYTTEKPAIEIVKEYIAKMLQLLRTY